ncbi:uncharacterized protein J7T54_002195 [Emericellopsis cladophorae]|uniref:GATA-type domain-containing protein n=1 Tax=Emericellopsis cladophorae TaxID=2686198 RepID=A0A9P9Y4H4_9HYPO|nr:uncharacterized protein J7T54_002195 [Emericellopsis cladophorae]KAI6783033.1 hypothetical protein J7T54_002195 [Emericellopsis cladophorae]
MPMEPSQNEGPGDADDVLSEHKSQPQAARQRKRKPRVPKGTLGGPRPAAQIPYQVFRMEDGPDGSQDMVHVCNYGTPEPTSAPALPPSDALPQPALHAAKAIGTTRPREIDSSKNTQAVSMAPTPPNTTDAIEKPTSPPLPTDQDQPTAQREPARPMPDLAFQSQPGQSEAQQPSFTPLPDAELGPSTGGVQPRVPNLLPSVEHASNETAPVTNSAKPTEQAAREPFAVAGPDAQPIPPQEVAPTSAAPKPRTKAPPKPRKLARSQSAGNLGLPNMPASEPMGPSSLSQSMTGDSDQVLSAGDPSTLRRAKSSGPTDVPVPASDPAGPTTTQAATTPSFALALPDIPSSTADGATSSQEEKTNKNLVKKTAIKQRLEAAIRKGEMPPYCSNCGAIETPTWRKIYGQNHEGLAPHHNPEEYSSKPGMVTTVDVVRAATEGKAGLYRVIKKNLGPNDDKSAWHELLLCNPCGIWLGKTFKLRPQNRWEGDAARLGQKRKKKSSCDVLDSRPVKSRTKSDGVMMPTSEACFPTTDAIGPDDFWSPSAGMTDQMTIDPALGREPTADSMTQSFEAEATLEPQSTNSTATETAKGLTQTEAARDAAMGTTKRLLFPSPRKDQPSTALGEVDINIVQTGSEHRLVQDSPLQKENLIVTTTPRASENFDDLEDLFRSPLPLRPTTPLNNGKAAAPTTPFKTPARATPSHRPITRSVSRSIKSKETMLASPLLTFKRTPSRTPSKPVLDDMALLATLSKQAHEGCEGNAMDFDESIFDTPLCRAVNQMLSESNFGMHDDDGMDLIDVDMNAPDWASFNTIFSTDAPVPSSPPMKAFPGQVDLSFEAQAQMSEPWSMDQMEDAEDDV